MPSGKEHIQSTAPVGRRPQPATHAIQQARGNHSGKTFPFSAVSMHTQRHETAACVPDSNAACDDILHHDRMFLRRPQLDDSEAKSVIEATETKMMSELLERKKLSYHGKSTTHNSPSPRTAPIRQHQSALIPACKPITTQPTRATATISHMSGREHLPIPSLSQTAAVYDEIARTKSLSKSLSVRAADACKDGTAQLRENEDGDEQSVPF
ncbi:hypothetical protein BDZ88DRAFT_481332 [Geranomyces variabilis]|nr:hypothetical protein BDZ88DRAFT_481332 [Geranomyces variabilis]KAJ3132475.1 hypothetical protein HDU90_006836 [Geranomyces variabilis]